MFVTMLKSKLHLARVTASNWEYEGSLEIDLELMDRVHLLPYEKILVSNMENGNRFETYAIPGPRGSGVIGLNGATTHLGKVGDRVIIFAFASVPAESAAAHRPLILVLDEKNQPVGGLKQI